MFTSFSTALSALSAFSTAIDVVGNNLANMNTPGFKTSEVCFLDLVSQSLGTGQGNTQVGFGTGQPLTVREFTQGAIQTSAGLLTSRIDDESLAMVRSECSEVMPSSVIDPPSSEAPGMRAVMRGNDQAGKPLVS